VPKQPNQHREISQALTALTLDNTIIETERISNTRASNQMTSNPSMLKIFAITMVQTQFFLVTVLLYQYMVLEIPPLNKKNNILPLHDALLVPDLKKLLFIS